MDIAVNLVESYLRLTGYFTLSEFEVQNKGDDGVFRSLTDVDVMAVRMPGDTYVGDPHDDCDLVLIEDPVLGLEPDCVDVIIGEVKQGEAQFNPGIRNHVVLHSMLRRVGWLYESPDLGPVVEALQSGDLHVGDARGGGRIRTRLVAFGRAPRSDLNVVSMSHIVATLLRFFEEHEDAFRPIQFRDPAPAFLRLLLKSGFDISKDALDQ